MTPTWTYIYTNDLNQKTCNTIPSCHIQWNSASSAYQYLQSQGCLPSMNCVAGFGVPGNMPLLGTISAQDTTDIQAWVAAGSQNN